MSLLWKLLSTAAKETLGPLLEQQAIEHLDEDWSIACEYPVTLGTVCPERATWWVICRDCGWLTSECAAHRQHEVDLWAAQRGFLACPGCRDFVPVEQWRSLFLITPIEGRP